jgi:hypothetical protein
VVLLTRVSWKVLSPSSFSKSSDLVGSAALGCRCCCCSVPLLELLFSSRCQQAKSKVRECSRAALNILESSRRRKPCMHQLRCCRRKIPVSPRYSRPMTVHPDSY